MKKLLFGLAALLIGGLVLVCVSLGSILKTALVTLGPKFLGAPVSVAVVTISPFTGEGSIRGLVIGNPPGFKTPHAIAVSKVQVALDVKSLLGGGRVLVKDVVVEKPEITLETGKGGTNLQVLQRNLENYAPASEGSKEAASGESRKVEISRFRLRAAKAEVLVSQLGSTKPMSVTLPDIEITGIGAKSGGATAAEAARQILGAVTASALKAAGGVENLVSQGLKTLGGSDAAAKLESLKGLFKKKK